MITRQVGKVGGEVHENSSPDESLANVNTNEQKNNISAASQLNSAIATMWVMRDKNEKAEDRMRATYELRRARVLEQADRFRSIAEFSREYNLDSSYIRQIKSGVRNVGEKVARDLEEAIGLPLGYLDIPFGDEYVEMVVRSALRNVSREDLQDILQVIEFQAKLLAERRSKGQKEDR